MKFVFKFVPTQALQELGEDIQTAINCIKDKETLVDGLLLASSIIAIYFILVVTAI